MVVLTQRSKIDDLKARADCRDIAQVYLGEPQHRSGKCFIYPAPHRDDNRRASFTVFPDGFKDFGGDGISGDHIKLIQLLDKDCSTFSDAVNKLRQFAEGNTALVSPHTVPRATTYKWECPSADWQGEARKVVEYGEHNLWSGSPDAKEILEYLHVVRGLSKEQIRKARLGYIPHRIKTGCQNAEGRDASLEAGIVIPSFLNGRLVAVRVRTRVGNLATWLGNKPDTRPEYDQKTGQWTERELDKYLSLAGSKPSSALYWSDHIHAQRMTVFVEGEFDCLLGDQVAGDLANFVTRGSASSGTMPDYVRTLVANAPFIACCLDNDRAGRQGTARLGEAFPGRVIFLSFPRGKDLTEFVVDHKGDVRQWLQEQLPLIESLHTVSIPDGVRFAALNLKKQHGLIAYELVLWALRNGLLDQNEPITASRLKEIVRDRKLNLDKNIIDRGLKDVGFFSKLPISIFSRDQSTSKESKGDSEKNSHPGGRPRNAYKPLPIEAVRKHLSEALHGSTVERHFPMHGEQSVIPPVEAEMLEGVKFGETLAKVTDDLKTTLAPAYQMQDEVNTRRRQKEARTDRQILRAALDCPYSTPLQSVWLANAKEYQKQLLQAGVEAGDIHNYQDVMLYLGVSRGAVPALLKAAGLRNDKQFELSEITSPDITYQACKKAKGHGHIVEFVAMVNDREVAWRKLYAGAVDEWGREQRKRNPAVQIFVRLQLSGKLAIAGAVEPSQKRPQAGRGNRLARSVQNAEPSNRSGITVKRSHRNRFGYRSGYVCSVLGEGYKRVNDFKDEDIYLVKRLSVADLVSLVRLKAPSEGDPASDAGQTEPQKDIPTFPQPTEIVHIIFDEQSQQRLRQLAVTNGLDEAIAGSLVKLFQGRTSLLAIRSQEIVDLYGKLSTDDQRWLVQVMPEKLHTTIWEHLNPSEHETFEAEVKA